MEIAVKDIMDEAQKNVAGALAPEHYLQQKPCLKTVVSAGYGFTRDRRGFLRTGKFPGYSQGDFAGLNQKNKILIPSC